MKKLFSKIATLSVGLVMAIGVGVAVASNKESVPAFAAEQTGTIHFGSASGSTNVNAASVKGDDSLGNEWTVTTVGTTSFTSNSSYAQIGSSSKPATSITFTTTLESSQVFTSFSAKFGGFSGTAGTVTLKVGDTTVGTGSLSLTSDVVISNSTNGTGTVLTVTVTDISKGVKAYYISYTCKSSEKGVAITGITSSGLYLKDESYDIGYEINGFDSEPTITDVQWTVPSGAGSIADGKWTAGSSAMENVKLELDLKANGDDYHAEVITNIDAVSAFKKSSPKNKFIDGEAFTVGHTFIVEYNYASSGTVAESDPGISYRLENSDGSKIKDIVYNSTKLSAADSGKYIDATYKGVDLSERYSITVLEVFNNTAGAYYLVTNASELSDGDHVVLYGYYDDGKGTTKSFVSSYVGSSNIQGESVVLDHGAIDGKQTFDVLDFELKDTSADLANSFAFSVSNDVEHLSQYLYTSASGSNYLKTQDSIDKNSRFVINIDATTHVASIVATESSNRKVMSANGTNTSKLFSCYSGVQADAKLYLYKWVSNADKVQEFIDNNMKMSEYVGDETYNKERCDANYAAAKAAFTNLTASQKALFVSEGGAGGTYEAAYSRFISWVNANGETFNPADGTFTKLEIASFVGSNTNSGFAIVIVIASVSIMAFGLAIMLRKKRQ